MLFEEALALRPRDDRGSCLETLRPTLDGDGGMSEQVVIPLGVGPFAGHAGGGNDQPITLG